jgi:DNA polymerase alpha subunit B
MCVRAALLVQIHDNATFVGAGLCQTFAIAPRDLFYKWETIVLTPHAIGQRYIDSTTPSAIRALIQSELGRAAASQKFKSEPGVRKARGADAASMLGLGSRMKLPGVGLVDTIPTSQPSFAMPQNVGKVGKSTIAFKCSDIEDVSQDKRNCTRQSTSK